MATLKERYLTDFSSTLSQRIDGFGLKEGDKLIITVTAAAHVDFVASCQIVSYFVDASEYTLPKVQTLIQHPRMVIDEANRGVEVTMGHSAALNSAQKMSDLPFYGRILLYVDVDLPETDARHLVAVAALSGFRLEIRDRRYSDYLSLHESPWAFISHDSRDKDILVRPLVEQLQSMSCPVWYDEFSLKVGDSIRESIDKGLNEAPKCILVLSKAFLSNPGWTKGEFNAAISKHFGSEGSVLLPIWYGVERREVESYSPLVADIKAIAFDGDVEMLARRLLPVISPVS